MGLEQSDLGGLSAVGGGAAPFAEGKRSPRSL